MPTLPSPRADPVANALVTTPGIIPAQVTRNMTTLLQSAPRGGFKGSQIPAAYETMFGHSLRSVVGKKKVCGW